jgi:hypothetical protein
MKKSEFKELIKDSVKEVLIEFFEKSDNLNTNIHQFEQKNDYKSTNNNKFEKLKKKNPYLADLLQQVDESNNVSQNKFTRKGTNIINENQLQQSNTNKVNTGIEHIDNAMNRNYKLLIKKMNEKQKNGFNK